MQLNPKTSYSYLVITQYLLTKVSQSLAPFLSQSLTTTIIFLTSMRSPIFLQDTGEWGGLSHVDIKQFPLAEQVKEVTEPLQDVYIHMQFPEGSGW